MRAGASLSGEGASPASTARVGLKMARSPPGWWGAARGRVIGHEMHDVTGE